jgi:hypothetical protein
MGGAPSVFISSTSHDLELYRTRAATAARVAGLLAVMSEDWAAKGEAPLDHSLAKVDECDVVVVIVAHRYGWKPKGGRGKSITWLECDRAVEQGKEVLAFLVDEKCEWPAALRDSYRIAEAAEKGTADAKLLADVQKDIAQLAKFKAWLNGRRIRGTFSSQEELQRKVGDALREWSGRQGGAAPTVVSGRGDPGVYLEQLREHCSWIDIRGLQVGTGKAHRFPIEDLYIPLTMSGAAEDRRLKPAPQAVLLEEALAHDRLVVVGDPGAGKTTFLRHVALARVREFSATKDRPFPIFVRVAELWASGAMTDAPSCLIRFLASRSVEFNQGLDEAFFRQKLEKGPAILLLDGLDEAPGTREREATVQLMENATRAWRRCRFVVTTRPIAYAGRTVLAGFETAQIEPLETAAIEKFLEHWCAALFPESEASAKRHLGELTDALRRVPEIRRMARNPVMLTALAVVHWNERRLPEQRADLYESILSWLARSREKKPGREPAERCLALLQQLALAMQRHKKGRQVEVEKDWAAEVLAPRFEGLEAALRFVEQEEAQRDRGEPRGQRTLLASDISGVPGGAGDRGDAGAGSTGIAAGRGSDLPDGVAGGGAAPGRRIVRATGSGEGGRVDLGGAG